ncbi:MAG TPA: hypothetical protein VM692_14650 [Gammaproteobacteria bacterium]|nr:hypothetical protein [Gammaproteobacteria bacterium]
MSVAPELEAAAIAAIASEIDDSAPARSEAACANCGTPVIPGKPS